MADTTPPAPHDFASMDELYSHLRWSVDRTPSVLAHRGAPLKGRAENAVRTYEAALLADPSCWLEIDIRTTADGAMVLMHDATLDRCSTGIGPLNARTFRELQALALRDVDGRPMTETIPTLDDVIDVARGRSVLFLDLKDDRSQWPTVLGHIRDRGADRFSVVLTYATEDTMLVHEIAPQMVVYGRATHDHFCDELLGCGIPHRQLVAWIHDTPPDVFGRLHDRGILTTFGTFLEVDRRAVSEGEALYHERIAAGADILNTDDVPRCRAAIASYGG